MTTDPIAADSAALLGHVDRLQRHVRGDLCTYWFSLVTFGLITLLSAPFTLIGDGSSVGYYWLLGGPVGGAAIGWYYRKRELTLGVGQSGTPFVLTGVGILVFAFLLPALTSGDLRKVVSVFAVAGGYLVFAWLVRSALLVLMSAALAALPLAVLAADIERPGTIVAVVSGAIILASGLHARHDATSHR